MQYEAVILDYGRVLCLPPAEESVRRAADVLGIGPERFLELYQCDRNDYDRGKTTPAEYWEKFAARAGLSVSEEQIEKLRQRDVAMWVGVNQPLVDWAAALRRARFKMAILSNMHKDMARYVRQNFRWLSHFDSQVLSCELGLLKPEPEIYSHALRGLGTAPNQTLFIDDSEANIAAARRLGIAAICYESMPQLRADLVVLNFSPAPDP